MPGGRPSKLDTVVRWQDRDGEQVPVTAFDHIVGAVRIGLYYEAAAASAGIARSTLFDWLRIGARLVARAAAADLDPDDPALTATLHERRCYEFSVAVAEATAGYEVEANTTLHRLGRGGASTTRTTVKTQRQERADGTIEFVEVERTVVTEVLAPNPQVLQWRLRHRFPSRYYIAGEADDRAERDPLTDAESARQLADELRGVLEAEAKPKRTRKAPAKADA